MRGREEDREARRPVSQGETTRTQGPGIPYSSCSSIDGQFLFCLFHSNAFISIPKMSSKKLVSKQSIKKKKLVVNLMGEVWGCLFPGVYLVTVSHNCQPAKLKPESVLRTPQPEALRQYYLILLFPRPSTGEACPWVDRNLRCSNTGH